MVAAQNIIGLEMDGTTARVMVQRIHEHLDSADRHMSSARELIWSLKEYKGWKALGYKSWRQCVIAEFEQSATNIYRQLDAAVVELELSPNGGQIGQINERVLRPLTKRNFNAEAKQAIWAISQEIVGAGGKVTSGITEAIVEGLEDMLRSGTTQDAEGHQLAITERMHADLVARVHEKKLAHKQNIQRMNKPRDYILGGVAVEKFTRGMFVEGKVAAIIPLENLTREKLLAALKTGKPIFVSLWTE